MKQQIIDLFDRISLPMKDAEGGAKVEEIIKFLSENGIESRYVSGQGILANEVPSPDKILMAHIDLIPLFRRGFSQEPRQVYELKITKKGDEVIVGALDNTICDAVALLAFVKLFNEGKIPNVTLFLSEGEEVGFIGASAFIRENKERLSDTFFVNLDVTNEGWGYSGSIEYDKPNFDILKLIQKELEDCFFTGERVCDDTDAVNREGLAGFSFCLPTKDVIHSYKNRAKTKTLEPYFDKLCKILTMELPKEREKDFSSWYFKEALECEDKEKFKEDIANRKNVLDQFNGYDGRYGYPSGENDYTESMYDDPMWYDSFMEFLYGNVYENFPSQTIRSVSAFSDSLFDFAASMVEFNEKDVADIIVQANIPPLLQDKFGINARTIVNKLLEFGVIQEFGKGQYQFVPQYV